MLTKTAKYGTPQAETTTYTYDQDRAGFYNVGHQTTAANTAATFKVAAVALANKTARIAWAVLVRGGTYQADKIGAAAREAA